MGSLATLLLALLIALVVQRKAWEEKEAPKELSVGMHAQLLITLVLLMVGVALAAGAAAEGRPKLHRPEMFVVMGGLGLGLLLLGAPSLLNQFRSLTEAMQRDWSPRSVRVSRIAGRVLWYAAMVAIVAVTFRPE